MVVGVGAAGVGAAEQPTTSAVSRVSHARVRRFIGKLLLLSFLGCNGQRRFTKIKIANTTHGCVGKNPERLCGELRKGERVGMAYTRKHFVLARRFQTY
jgi:hypothetical protein